jgi:hypothetical protein
MNHIPLRRRRANDADEPTSTTSHVTDESLILRNYDADPVQIKIRLIDADNEVAFDRTYALGPQDVVSTPTRLPRGVYRVVAAIDGVSADPDDASETTRHDTTECLVGSAPTETVLVETGNGVISVTEGFV